VLLPMLAGTLVLSRKLSFSSVGDVTTCRKDVHSESNEAADLFWENPTFFIALRSRVLFGAVCGWAKKKGRTSKIKNV
jgi:hypothetical protein